MLKIIYRHFALSVIEGNEWWFNSIKITQMERKWFIFYKSFYDAGKYLSDDERLDFYDRICNYWCLWVDKKKSDKVEMLFLLIKPLIDNSIKNWDVSKNQWHHWIKGKEFGKLWGRPKKIKPPKTPLRGKKNNPLYKDKDKDKDIDKDTIKKSIKAEKFEEFRNIYPTKKWKEKAKQNFYLAIKEVDPDTIIQWAKNYALEIQKSWQEKIKYPQWWLTDKRWEDEVVQTKRRDGFKLL